MNSARKLLVNGAKPGTASVCGSHPEPAGCSVASASPSNLILEMIGDRKDGSLSASVPQPQVPVNGDMPADEDRIQDVRPMTRKLGEIVRTFCRTPERERRIELLAVMQQAARRLRNTFSAANFEALAMLTFALERLFTGLSKDVGALNGSTLKTVSLARLPLLAQEQPSWPLEPVSLPLGGLELGLRAEPASSPSAH